MQQLLFSSSKIALSEGRSLCQKFQSALNKLRFRTLLASLLPLITDSYQEENSTKNIKTNGSVRVGRTQH